MKTMRNLFLGLIVVQFSQANACVDLNNNDETLTVCTGDNAIVANMRTAESGDGVVVGVNPRTRKISVDFTNGSSRFGGIGTYNFYEATFGNGCYGGACVGDKGIRQNGNRVESGDGIIVGINPITEKVSINFSHGTSRFKGIGTYDLDEITIGKGCFAGVCVGDRAVRENGNAVESGDGVVVGINPSTGRVAIDFNQGTSRFRGIGTYYVDSITVGSYCVEYGPESTARYTMNKFEFYENFSK
ncbi:MAG: hypothetical protein CME62_01700 [Halobacteriovoraceae bacterium]|nr:hypothetical protein [Halobacteriovoraceae bacterium]|tara:strand:- start:5940 stop:6671 length:732 start_codon:yes stop_codon:yes gene_type:complete